MRRRPTVLVACALALAACGDYSAPSEVVNGVAVASLQAPGTNFAQYKTFTVTDKIQVYDNTGSTGQQYTQDAPQIIDEIKTQMTNLGFTFVSFNPAANPQPHLVIALYAYKGTQSFGTYYCDWWYYGYYPYGCYGGYYYYGEYNTGALVMRMADFKNAPPGGTGTSNLPIVWGSASYGVLATQGYNLQRVLNAIDTAFAQSSSYLHP